MPKQVYYCSPGPMPLHSLAVQVNKTRSEFEEARFLYPGSLALASGFLLATNTRLNRAQPLGVLESYVRSFVIFHTLRSWLTHADGIVSVATAAEKNGFYNFWLRILIHIFSLFFVLQSWVTLSNRCPFTVSLLWLRKWLS